MVLLEEGGGVMHPAILVFAVALTAVLSWIATGIVRRHAEALSMLDIPNERSSHSTPTARGGGLAIVAVFLCWLPILGFLRILDADTAIGLFVGGVPVALIGYLDDRMTMRARTRFIVHLSAAVFLVSLVGGIPGHSLRMLGLQGQLAGAAVGVVLVAWSTNLFNFMDGIDGIAASEAIFVATSGALLNWLHQGEAGLSMAMLALAASTFGFLIWNWPPARIFMGDAGSGFIGFSLGGLGLAASQTGAIPIEAWAILGGIFLVDASLTLIRRFARGDRWFEAHRMHGYQHLARRWRSHRPVTCAVLLVNLCWLLPWAYAACSDPVDAGWFLAAALVPLGLVIFAIGAGRREG